VFWNRSRATPHKVQPVRRRSRVLYAKHYTPLKPTHSHEVHHVHFQREGGTDDHHNLKKLTVEQHRALHNIADKPLRSKNGKRVMSRKGHASDLGKRRQQIHRSLVGEAHYSSYMSQLSKKRWKAYRVNQGQRPVIATNKK
jgi:hypothetical protein